MNTELFVGGSIVSVGEENFSTVARFIMKRMREQFYTCSIAPDSYIGIYTDGDVFEAVRMDISATGSRYNVEIVNGIITQFATRDADGEWMFRDISDLNIYMNVGNYDVREEMAREEWIEQSMRAEEWEAEQEEANLLREMMWDTESHMPEAAWQRLASLER